jgi:hypothetical protein
MTARKRDRLERYAEYRIRGEDQACAALRVPVSPRTARRYEQDLRKIRERSTTA